MNIYRGIFTDSKYRFILAKLLISNGLIKSTGDLFKGVTDILFSHNFLFAEIRKILTLGNW